MENTAKITLIGMFFAIIIIGLIVILKLFYDLITIKITEKKTKQFFTKHKPYSGEVEWYKKEDGRTYTTLEFQGKYKPSKQITHHVKPKYYIALKCIEDDLQYIAVYEIRPQEYNNLHLTQKSGSTINIKSSWKPIAYKIL